MQKNLSQKKKKNYLVTKPNYHTSKYFTEESLAIEMKKAEKLMNKLVYLLLSILELRKILIYGF